MGSWRSSDNGRTNRSRPSREPPRQAYRPRPGAPGPRFSELVAQGLILPDQPWRGQHSTYWAIVDGQVRCVAWNHLRRMGS